MRSENGGKSWRRGKPKEQQHHGHRCFHAQRAKIGDSNSFPSIGRHKGRNYPLVYGRIREINSHFVVIELGRGARRHRATLRHTQMVAVHYSKKHGLVLEGEPRCKPSMDQIAAVLQGAFVWCTKHQINEVLPKPTN